MTPRPGAMVMADALQKIKSESTREQFEHRYPHLWIIRHLDPDERPPTTFNTVAWDTKPVEPAPSNPPVLMSARLRGDPGRFGLHPVTKLAKVWSEQILVGRALNNDIIFRHESVSKLHAYFTRRRDGAWMLCDAKSANGTTVDGTRLRGGEQAEVATGSIVLFGHLACEIIGPGELYDAL